MAFVARNRLSGLLSARTGLLAGARCLPGQAARPLHTSRTAFSEAWTRSNVLLAATGAGAFGACAYSTRNLLKTDFSGVHACCEAGVAEQPEVLRTKYPAVTPYNSGHLKVSAVHELYFEESGNPNGKPVIFVHGGPGGGTNPSCSQFFDPEVYRIILLDQRGSGKSTPFACLKDNTTWHLVADMEKLRTHLNIEKWQVFGGSWGSTLALSYAVTHPERVSELVLRGIFLLRKHEIDWMYQSGASYIYPDAWEGYRDAIPEAERHDFVGAYHRRLTGKNEEEKVKAARAWSKWELETSFLFQKSDFIQKVDDDHFTIAFARIENHYFINGGFFPTDNYLIENVDKIRHIPTVIVQGRYDVVCPITSAWDLHRAFPEAEFHIVQDAGHSANEVGITHLLVTATDIFKRDHPALFTPIPDDEPAAEGAEAKAEVKAE